MDGRSAGVEPALATGNAGLLTNAEVTSLETRDREISAIHIRYDGTIHRLAAKRVILAAGALGSAHLMLASDPKGLANSSGLVGRNLMFHLNEMFALWPNTKGSGH